MIGYLGEYDVVMDGRGRFTLPSPLRHELIDDSNRSLIITPDPRDKCLQIYPIDEWDLRIKRILGAISIDSSEGSRFISTIMQRSVKVLVADNGKINVPTKMINYAKIDKEAILSGGLGLVKLWNPDIYQKSLLSDDEYGVLFDKYFGVE